MVELIEAAQQRRVRPLFAALHLGLVLDAVLAGNSPGVMWAGDTGSPRSVLLWDKGHCFYLAGAADNVALNAEWAERLRREVLPQAAARGLSVFKVHYSDAEWEEPAAGLFRNLALTRRTRAFYTLGTWAAGPARSTAEPLGPIGVPEGLVLQPIDRALLADRELVHRGELVAEIESMWPSVGRFLDYGFGLCLLRGKEIVCRCTAEYVSGKQCGVGIATFPGYEGRGLATLTARAFVARCLREGIAPHWDCWTSNLPSVAVAEKVGFVRDVEYAVWFGVMNDGNV